MGIDISEHTVLKGCIPVDENSYSSEPPQSVNRSLFGPVDHEEVMFTLNQELKNIADECKRRWNFDFEAEKPINSTKGSYVWERIVAPDFYMDEGFANVGNANSRVCTPAVFEDLNPNVTISPIKARRSLRKSLQNQTKITDYLKSTRSMVTRSQSQKKRRLITPVKGATSGGAPKKVEQGFCASRKLFKAGRQRV